MGSLGVPELIFIFVLALLIFGPKKLPEIGRTVGKGMAEFRKATNELKRSINTELALDETPSPQLHSRRYEPDTEPVAPPLREVPPLTEPRSPNAAPASVPPSSDPLDSRLDPQ
jgi:sec-independent protein translocase protein TatA